MEKNTVDIIEELNNTVIQGMTKSCRQVIIEVCSFDEESISFRELV